MLWDVGFVWPRVENINPVSPRIRARNIAAPLSLLVSCTNKFNT